MSVSRHQSRSDLDLDDPQNPCGGNEIAAARLGALLAALAEEAIADRPADIGDGKRGLLAGLADPKMGVCFASFIRIQSGHGP